MRRLLIAVTVIAVVGACSGAGPTSPRTQSTGGPRTAVASPDDLSIPGVTVSGPVNGDQTLAAAMPCDQLTRLVAATDWRVTQLAPAPLDIYAMSLGTERALLHSTGSKSSCRGIVTHAIPEPLKLSGADTVDTANATFAPFMCSDNNVDDDNEYELLGLYDAGDLHLLLDVSFNIAAASGPAKPGDGDLGVAMVAHGSASMTEVLAGIMAAAAAGQRPDVRQLEIYQANGAFKGTATVKKGDAIDGTLQLSGLATRSGKQLAVGAGFHCSLAK